MSPRRRSAPRRVRAPPSRPRTALQPQQAPRRRPVPRPASGSAVSAGTAVCPRFPNAALTSSELRYQRITAGMIAIAKPTPVPGKWKNARTASNRAMPAMISAKSRAHGCSDQRPTAARSQMIPVRSASHPHRPTCSNLGRSPRTPNQSNPRMRSPRISHAEPRKGREKTEYRDEDGRVFQLVLLPLSGRSNTTPGRAKAGRRGTAARCDGRVERRPSSKGRRRAWNSPRLLAQVGGRGGEP